MVFIIQNVPGLIASLLTIYLESRVTYKMTSLQHYNQIFSPRIYAQIRQR